MTINVKAYDMNLLPWSSVDQEPSKAGLESCLGPHKVNIKVLARLGFGLQVLGEGSLPGSLRHWKNSVPCIWRTEVPVSLLADGQKASTFFLWLMGPSICKASDALLNTSVLQISVFFFCFFEGLVWLHWAQQDKATSYFCLKVIYLVAWLYLKSLLYHVI